MMQLYRKKPTTYSCILGDETILLDAKNSRYIGLNSTASLIWGWLDSSPSLEQIVGKLTELFHGDPESVRNDVQNVLTDLLDRELIQLG